MNQTVKPELKSPEMKKKFLYQFYGQNVLVRTGQQKYPYKAGEIVHWAAMATINVKNVVAQLTPLELISDEDAIEVAKICLNPKEKPLSVVEILQWGWCKRVIVNRQSDINNPDVMIDMFISINYGDCEIKFTWNYNHSKGTNVREMHCPNASAAYDYLRSKGYAVRWMGYKVEELIEAGYMKLREGGESE